jgi:fatty acid synthase
MRRRKDGLPGVAIQWGLIGAVGVMLHTTINSSLAFQAQHIDSCLDSLHTLLFSDHAVVSCYLRRSENKAAAEKSSLQRTLSQRVAHVLGVEPKKVNSTMSLATMGMDSLQSVEVSNLIKKVKSVDIRGDNLKNLTWLNILEMD